MTKDIYEAAFTNGSHPYPAFINAQREGENVTICIRGEARDGGVGPRASITMTIEEFRWFIGEMRFRQVATA